MTALESASRCRRSATSSSTALQALSTRAVLKSHSPIWLAIGAGGGASTFTMVVVASDRPRSSVQVAFTLTAPEGSPAVSRVALSPEPESWPAFALHPPIVTGRLSGLVQLQLMVEASPERTVDGLAEQEIRGGFLGGSFTMKCPEQLPMPFLPSLTCTPTL